MLYVTFVARNFIFQCLYRRIRIITRASLYFTGNNRHSTQDTTQKSECLKGPNAAICCKCIPIEHGKARFTKFFLPLYITYTAPSQNKASCLPRYWAEGVLTSICVRFSSPFLFPTIFINLPSLRAWYWSYHRIVVSLPSKGGSPLDDFWDDFATIFAAIFRTVSTELLCEIIIIIHHKLSLLPIINYHHYPS